MGGIKNGWKIAFLKLPRSGFVHQTEINGLVEPFRVTISIRYR
jgi:hypothetical protein